MRKSPKIIKNGPDRTRHLKAAERFNQIREFVNYNWEDSDYGARKIKEDYDRLWPLIHQPHTTYSTSSNANRAIAGQSVGLSGREKRIRRIPVPTAGVENVQIRIKGGRLIITSDFVTTTVISFNKTRLAKSGPEYVDGLVSKFDPVKSRFKIQTGNYEIAVGYHRDHIASAVERLKAQYKVGKLNPHGKKVKRGQGWKSWLNGLAVMTGQNQKNVRDVLARQQKDKKASYKKNKKKKVK